MLWHSPTESASSTPYANRVPTRQRVAMRIFSGGRLSGRTACIARVRRRCLAGRIAVAPLPSHGGKNEVATRRIDAVTLVRGDWNLRVGLQDALVLSIGDGPCRERGGREG